MNSNESAIQGEGNQLSEMNRLDEEIQEAFNPSNSKHLSENEPERASLLNTIVHKTPPMNKSNITSGHKTEEDI